MAYIAARPGLGAWYDPFSWGTPDDAAVRKTAGDVRYVKQLQIWTQQTRLWFNGRLAIARDAGNTAAMQQIAQALGNVVKVEDHIAPYLQQIADAQRQVIADGNEAPTDWVSLVWPGWQGTAAQPPTAPPTSRPLTEAEANGGLGAVASGGNFLYLLALILVGVVFFMPATIIGTILSVGAVGGAVAAAAVGSPAGQEAIRDLATTIPLAAAAMSLPLLVLGGVAVLMFTAGGRKRK